MLPTGSYNDYELTILNETCSWAFTTMVAEMDGDNINEAIVRRNLLVEDKLGVIITSVDIASGDVAKTIKATQTTNEDADLYWMLPQTALSLACTGNICDTNIIDSMDTDNEWWYPEVTDSINFGGTRYMLFSDIHLQFHQSYYIVAFNKNMINDRTDMENPYDLVADDKWTIDVMLEMMEKVADDGGDGKMDHDDDVFGLCAHNNQGYSMMTGLGTIICDTSSTKPKFNGLDQYFTDVYMKILTTLYDAKYTVNTDYDPVFASGRSLFMIEVTGALREHRDNEFEYGIVVIPKYDQRQKEYISPITTNVISMSVSSNRSAEDYNRLGVILENMAGYSNEYLKPEFYNVLLHYKYAKDEESIEMLNVVYESGKFELAYVFDLGSIRTSLENLFKNDLKTVASAIGTKKTAVNNQINKIFNDLKLG